MPQRYATSRIDAVERTPSGAVRVNATPTAVGVFTYRRADGTEVRELRAPEEVFHADSLASLEDAAVTINHPPGGVTPARFRDLAVGHVRAGSVRADADAGVVRAGMVIARQDAIELAGLKPMLSCGYGCDIDPTPGEWRGQRYDQAQKNIRYNHTAMLTPGNPGRMGNVCRLDAAGEEIADHSANESTETLMKITIAGKTYENEADAQAAVTALEARADAATARADALTETVARADAERAAAEHAALVTQVKSVMGPAFVVTRKDDKGAEVALTARELRVAVIKRADSAFSDAGRDDAYIAARFDATLAVSAKSAEVLAALNGNGQRTDSASASQSASRADALYNQITEQARKAGTQFVS